MNMEYCRFRNTLQDLMDCAEHLFEKGLSREEEQARKNLIKECRDIAYVCKIINSGEIED